MCYNNVGITEKARHQGVKSKTVHTWTSAYAVRNRVNGIVEDDFTCFATDVPLTSYLPSENDMAKRRDRMNIIVQRILIAHMPYFKDCPYPDHIKHEYSTQLAEKSHVVSLGVIQENPGTLEGNRHVMTKLHDYVPFPAGKAYQPIGIPVHGDAATVLGMMKAKTSKRVANTPTERLEGIWPVPGEFHRRMLYLQDVMNDMYKESKNEPGTLYNIKNKFTMKSVKAKVSDSFNHVEDLVHLATKGLVCLAAMHILNLDELSATSDADPADLHSQ